jgi:hypothetical protein
MLREYIETVFTDEASRNQAIMVSLGADRHDATRPARSYEYLGFVGSNTTHQLRICSNLATDVTHW